MKLIIEDDEGRKTVVPIVREEITIGRQDGNTIRLTERNVSRRHARLVKDNGALLIEDLGSYNGVRVNGDRIAGPTKIKEGDLIEIGDYDLGIQGKLDTPMAQPPSPAPAAARSAPAAVAKPAPALAPKPAAAPPPPPPPAAAPSADTTAPMPPVSPEPAPDPALASASAGGATAIIRISDIMKNVPQIEARDLQKNEMPRLVGLAGPVRGKEFYLMRTEVKFGRTEDNDIGIEHQSVSRQHCKFVLDQGQWKVIDNKSANGVRVNGEEYAISAVKPGDTLELGHLKFRFCAPGEKFSPPPEKVEGAPEKPVGGLKPTTAELMAGVSKTPTGSSAKAKPAAAGMSTGMMAGIGGGVVLLLAIVAFLATRVGKKESGEEGGPAGESNLSADAATKQGDSHFKKHEYLKASELYEAAAAKGANPGNRKRAASEAKGEETYSELESAISGGNFDKAKTLVEKCSAETSHWCGKAAEKADAVKAGYGKAHLAKATAAKGANKLDDCTTEVNLVIGFDPGNADAQALATQCQPAEAAQKTPPAEPKGPSQAERNGKAAGFAAEANAKLAARDFSGAVAKCTAALALHPSDRTTLGSCYHSLGFGYAYLSDNGNAKKFLKQYLPYATTDKPQIEAFIATH